MKNILLALGLSTMLLASATACSSPNPQPASQPMAPVSSEEYIGVCMDNETQQRIDDKYCDDDGASHPQYMPYYYPYGYSIPGVGLPIYGGFTSINGAYRMGFPGAGGTSSSFKASAPMKYPKGYTPPPNVSYKPAVPTAPQPTAPAAGTAKSPAPVAPASAAPSAPKVTTAPVAPSPAVSPKPAYKAPSTTNKQSSKPAYKAPAYKAPARTKSYGK